MDCSVRVRLPDKLPHQRRYIRPALSHDHTSWTCSFRACNKSRSRMHLLGRHTGNEIRKVFIESSIIPFFFPLQRKYSILMKIKNRFEGSWRLVGWEDSVLSSSQEFPKKHGKGTMRKIISFLPTPSHFSLTPLFFFPFLAHPSARSVVRSLRL